LMPEQIAIAERLGLPNARFLSADATRVAALGDTCADFVVIFGILHHVEAWPQAVAECRRLLRPGGILLVEEPDASLLRGWDRVFRWDHPRQGFSLAGLERELDAGGLTLERAPRVAGRVRHLPCSEGTRGTTRRVRRPYAVSIAWMRCMKSFMAAAYSGEPSTVT